MRLEIADDSLDTACGTDTTTEAVVSSGSGTRLATLQWGGTAPEEHRFEGPGPHRVTIGPFTSVSDADGTDAVEVVATVVDAEGRAAPVTREITVAVAPC